MSWLSDRQETQPKLFHDFSVQVFYIRPLKIGLVVMNSSSRAELAKVSVPERAGILLFVLTQLGEVVTELKLQKLVFQVQSLAKIPKGYRYVKHYYGPYSRELRMDTCTLANEDLIQRERVIGREYPYWVFRVTDRGKTYFNQSILPHLPSQSLHRMQDTLGSYSSYNHYQLAEIVYRQWELRDPQNVCLEIQALQEDILAVKSFWETVYFPECPAITYFLAFLEYSQEALSKVSITEDTVVKSVLVRACRELNDNLASIAEVCSKKEVCPLEAERGLCQNPDPSVYEVFDFIEDFCERHGILPKLSQRELTELMTEDEYKRLQNAFKSFRT